MPIPDKTEEFFEFDQYRLEVFERRLLKDGQVVQLPPKVFDLLLLLVRDCGRLLEKEYLLKTLWPDSFVEESNLTVNVSALRRALGLDGPRLIETVPKRGYRFTAEVRTQDEHSVLTGEPPASPVPEQLTAPVPRQAVPSKWILASVAAMILCGLAVWSVRSGRSGPAEIHGLAVLPFMSLTADGSRDYIGLGMADAIITRITSLKKIEVRPTNAVLTYTKRTRDALKAGNELHVDAVLDGRIQQAGEHLRITAQLLRVRDGKQLWAAAFDDEFGNIFSVQDAIAAGLVKTLDMPVSELEQLNLTKRSTQNTEAYRCYIQGQYLASKRLAEATVGAIENYQKAIQLDPGYAQPYAALAISYLYRGGEGLEEGLREKAGVAARKALILDGKLPESYLSMGQVLMRSEWDWRGAEKAFRQSIELTSSNSAAHAGLSTLCTALGRFAEAISEMQIACQMDPRSASLRSDLAWTYHFARRFDKAVSTSREAVDLDPWSFTAHRQLAKALMFSSRFPEAVEEANRCLQINAGQRRRLLAELATVHLRAGQKVLADSELGELETSDWDMREPSYEMAVLFAARGDRDLAIQALGRAAERRLTRLIWMKTDPELDSLRTDPRYIQLVARMGL